MIPRVEGRNPHIIKSGLIFWIVSSVNKPPQLKTSDTLKSQVWKGAAPNLIPKLTTNKSLAKTLRPIKNKRALKIIKIEARVWVKKYLIEASLEIELFLPNRIGKNASVFNSSPIHEINKEGEEITRMILEKILKIINTKAGESHIRKEV